MSTRFERPIGRAVVSAVASAAVHVDVEQVPVHLVFSLRQRVLRPHQRIAEVGFDGDSTGTHFAAFDDVSAIVGVASLIGLPPDADGRARWRLRGMATDPDRQGQGVGRALMLGLLDFVGRGGGGSLGCSARVHAVGFYQRFGFVATGEVFEEPDIGSHVRMERTVQPLDTERLTE